MKRAPELYLVLMIIMVCCVVTLLAQEQQSTTQSTAKIYVELDVYALARYDDFPLSRDSVIVEMINEHHVAKDAFVYDHVRADYIVRFSPQGTRCRWMLWRIDHKNIWKDDRYDVRFREETIVDSNTTIKSSSCIKDAVNAMRADQRATQ